MKLLEFFSVNNQENEDEQSKDQIEKDLMGFILDDDDIYKEKMLPIIQKLKKGEPEDALKEQFLELVNDACIKFYKEEELKTDPNKHFPMKLRMSIVKNLIDLNKNSLKTKKKKDEQDAD